MPGFLKSLLLVLATSATMLVTARDFQTVHEQRGLRKGNGMRHLHGKNSKKDPLAPAAPGSKKASKKAKAPSAKAPSGKGAKSSKAANSLGLRVEVPLLAPEQFFDERIDITANETLTNETFALETLTNETLPPTEVFSNETDFLQSNETDFLTSNETDFLTSNETETQSPTKRIQLVGARSSCVTYNESTLSVEDCDVAGDLADWEVLESSDPALFQLRHVASQLCIPENPENPRRPFTCWLSETDKAVGDTINGLVDCASPFAAFVGFIDAANPSYLYNAICSVGDVGAPSDVVLMAYTADGSTELLWGEKILLDVPKMTADAAYTLSGSFFLA